MRYLPRLALGSIQPAVRQECLWALAAALQMRSEAPLLIRSSCRLSAQDASQTILGRPSRHLDSWAMSRTDTIAALARAASERDLVLVTGQFHTPSAPPSSQPASSLNTLCRWLDLPRVAIVDVRQLAACSLVPFTDRYDGLLLDRVRDAGEAAYWQTTLEALSGSPVLGWLADADPSQNHPASPSLAANPSRELCDELAARLLPTLRIDRLRALAHRAPPLPIAPEPLSLRPAARPFRIAVAFDEAYACYYPETLELLEAAGAELCDFSPLRSESLPKETNIVYFGCGHPERHLAELASNHCLMQSLRCHAARGGRIYAEGSGLAYLCREIVMPDGSITPFTNLLPITARYVPDPQPAEPTELTFGATSWLAPASVAIRGYRHLGWQLEPRGPLLTYARDSSQRLDMLGRGNVIASRILINLAANRHLLHHFSEPYAMMASSTRD
jgi:cobyrinic acid a,c-diamide synthase